MASEVRVRKIRENMLYFAGKLHSEHIGSTKASAIDLTGEDIIDLTGDDAVHTNRLIPALDSDDITAEMLEALQGLEEALPLFSLTDREALIGLDEGRNIDRAALDLGLLAINYRNEILRSRKERVPAVMCLGTEFFTSDISEYVSNNYSKIIIPLKIGATWLTAVIDINTTTMTIFRPPGVRVNQELLNGVCGDVRRWALTGYSLNGGVIEDPKSAKATAEAIRRAAAKAAREALEEAAAREASKRAGEMAAKRALKSLQPETRDAKKRLAEFQERLYRFPKTWCEVKYGGNAKVDDPFDTGAYMLSVASLIADGRPLDQIGFRNIKKVPQNILVSYVMMAVRDLPSYGRLTEEQNQEAEDTLACLESLAEPPAMILHDDFQNLRRQVETVLDELHLETTKAIVLPRFIAAADAQEREEAARVEAEKKEAEARADADRRRREEARVAAEKKRGEARNWMNEQTVTYINFLFNCKFNVKLENYKERLNEIIDALREGVYRDTDNVLDRICVTAYLMEIGCTFIDPPDEVAPRVVVVEYDLSQEKAKAKLDAAKKALQIFDNVGGVYLMRKGEVEKKRVDSRKARAGSEKGKEWVKLLMQEDTWATESEIAALSRILGVHIIVKQRQGGEDTEYQPSGLDPFLGGQFGVADQRYEDHGTGAVPTILIFNDGNKHYTSSNFRYDKKSDPLIEIDRGGYGDCLFRAVVDQLHFNELIFNGEAPRLRIEDLTKDPAKQARGELVRLFSQKRPYPKVGGAFTAIDVAHELRQVVAWFQSENPDLRVGDSTTTVQDIPLSPELLGEDVISARLREAIKIARNQKE